MGQKNIQWLYDELTKWIEAGVVTEEHAEKIRLYYGDPEEKNWLKIALGIFGTIGAILIGTGIILLLARNWQELSRTVRTVLSLIPMIIGQILVGWVIYTNKESIAWREGTSIFLTLTIGSSIALIGQTYHIPGDLGSFMFTWMLLVFPLAYLMDVALPAIAYMIGITVWAAANQMEGGYAVAFWILLSLLVPHILRSLKRDIFSNRSVFLLWGTTIVLCVAIGITLEKVLPGLWIIVYSSYFAILLLVDKLWLEGDFALWQRPYKVVGNMGALVMALLGSYSWPWDSIGWKHYRVGHKFHQWASYVDYIVAFALFAIAIYLIYKSFAARDKRKLLPILYGSIPILALLGYLQVSLTGNSDLMVLVYNLYVLIIGIVTVVNGIKSEQMGITNGGMLIISLLIILRFFDMELGFTVRGIAFISIGVGFLVSNYMLVQRKKGELQ